VLYNLGNGHNGGQAVSYDKKVYGNGLLTFSKGEKSVDGFLGVYAAGEFHFDFNLVRGEVIYPLDFQPAGFCRRFHAVNKAFRGRPEGQFCDQYALWIRGVEFRPDKHLPVAVAVFGYVHESASGKIRVQLEFFS